MDEPRNELQDLGEFGLIDRLTEHISLVQPSTIKGVGDDAAVIASDDDTVKLLTTDLLIENIHFDLMYVPLKHLGYKAAAVNLSDIYAMNGIPQQITVSIALSNRFSLEAVEELYTGIRLACKRYDVDLVGGDTSSSQTGLFLSVTTLGEAKKGEVVYRDGAKENDLIFVSGDLGSAYIGLLLLEREKQVFRANPNMQPDFEGVDYLLERQLKPEPRKDIIEMFRELDIKPTSMIDISDGLASELHHICSQSKKGCAIYEDKLPVDPLTYQQSAAFAIDPTTAAMNGGEDYELLFTVKQSDYEKLKDRLEITPIGYITDAASGLQLISKKGVTYPIKAQGWNHLKNEG
ncbi:MAG: thiamine-phosphate kinase [Bacteroidales bacterium]|jgi:thiamine-monophosphate kinase|nr:thiamine-phosphate kinase [Bacteroidales bacterium]